jgi:flavin reductase ActVB
MVVRSATFREAMARVAMPVSVVTTVDISGTPRGVTVGTLCSVSLNPPLVMFCLDLCCRSHEALTSAPRILIHVLRSDQADIAARFARTDVDRFEGLSDSWHGLPTIPDTAVRLVGARHEVVAGGDHTLVVCLVEAAEVASGDPLLYYARGYCTPSPLALFGSR